MPLYDYRCGICKQVKEVYQSFSGDALVCCGVQMDRLLCSPSIIAIKGEGGVKVHSKGYKEGYAQDYQRRLAERREKTAAQ